jgi:hypothetical protein
MMVSEAMIEASARADAAYAGRTFDALASADKVRFTERAKLMLEAALSSETTIADLQRENAELKIDASNHAADAETVRREREAERLRAEAAEAQVKRLRNKVGARVLTDQQLADEIEAVDEACKGGFGEGGGSPGEWWYERADELEHERKYRELEGEIRRHNSRTALASTGGEHHAE